MKKLSKIAIIIGVATFATLPSQSANAVMCPDGSFVSGSTCTLCPDGSYVGDGQCNLQPDGTYN